MAGGEKIKILFVAHLMNIGGIEKSLLSLIGALPADRFDIYLQLTELKGPFLGSIPPHVHVSDIPPFSHNIEALERPMKWIASNFAKLKLRTAIGASWAVVRSLMARSRNPYYDYLMRREPMPRQEYDVAVSYPGPSEMHDRYVAREVKAARKFGWIHFDIDHVFHRPASIRAAYRVFDRIFVVDEAGKAILDRNYPEFASKTEVFHNLINPAEIVKKGAETPLEPLPEGVKRLVTVGRINHPKAQDIACHAARILKDRGYKFVWHMIGDGLQFEEYSALPEQLGVADCVRFEGATLNPYPWMAAADVYVQPSRHEGYCITVAEARCFGCPIVATDFAGSAQLNGYPNHHICGHSPQEIADAVATAMGETRSEVPLPKNDELSRLIEIFEG